MRDVRLKLVGSERYRQRRLEAIRYLVVHHSGVDRDSSAEEIAAYHVAALGWPGIGYHFVVRWNGDIECAGDLATVRYHVAGANEAAVGICLPGNFDSAYPTEEQLGAARNLCRMLMPVLDPAESGVVRVRGHREVALSPTNCPGATWDEWKWVFGEWV